MDAFIRKILEKYLIETNRTDNEKKRTNNRREYIAKRLHWLSVKDRADTYCRIFRRGGGKMTNYVKALPPYSEKLLRAWKYGEWEEYEKWIKRERNQIRNFATW